MGAKVKAPLAHIALDFLKPDRGQLLLAVRADRGNGGVFLKANHNQPPYASAALYFLPLIP